MVNVNLGPLGSKIPLSFPFILDNGSAASQSPHGKCFPAVDSPGEFLCPGKCEFPQLGV